jgi:hypothetical protein
MRWKSKEYLAGYELKALLDEAKDKYDKLSVELGESYGKIPMEEYHNLYMSWCDAKTMYGYYKTKYNRRITT